MTSVKGYILSGRHAFKKLNDKELEEYDRWFQEYKEQLEREISRKLTEKEEERTYFLILGVIKRHNEYDERYHKYLLGATIKED